MVKLTDKEFQHIVQLVKKTYGVNLEKKRVLIECRLRMEMEKSQSRSFQEYLKQVEADPTHQLAEQMIHKLTTHYTYFFREYQHFEYIREKILPYIGERDILNPFSAWCAGCASGEEVYTLAMLLEEYKRGGGYLPSYQILGTDISQEVLNEGMEGIYPKREIEKLPGEWIKRYCIDKKDGTFQIVGWLRNKVRFQKQNLMELQSSVKKYDLILCRNVMIYFELQTRLELVKKLEQSMKKDGYLMVGHSELLPRECTSLVSVATAVYKKE